ncbi:MAG: Do family serine endopeptidase, partial [Deltaproteobacteria bacterium]|nr:Do family serine endopeptidase [Deltaproteobacteria bacterium]
DLSRSVVNISVEAGAAEQTIVQQQEGDDAQPPIPPQLQKQQPQTPYRSLGSGFIINEEGYILTNNHVIDNSDTIIVRLLDDKTEYSAQLIGKDPKTDIALIKIEPKGKLSVAYLGDSDKVEVGEWVIAIGNQFQLGQTVTAGIVSAKSRKLPYQASGPYDSFIQTDASINPGSSGGPLFNTRGQVIGINTAIFSPGRQQFGSPGFNIGIGFSIPINLVKGLVQQLKEKGKVTRGVLGVLIQPVDSDVAEALGLPSADGALVADVLKTSPAGKAGFQRRDVIVKFNGHPVVDHDDLPLMVATTPIGSKVDIEVLRGKEKLTMSAVIEELKDAPVEKPKDKEKSDAIGVVVEKLPDEIAQGLALQNAQGVFVKNVDADSPAEKAGIQRGDIVLEFGGTKITSVEDFEKCVAALKKGKPVLLLVQKKEGTRFLTLKLK